MQVAGDLRIMVGFNDGDGFGAAVAATLPLANES